MSNESEFDRTIEAQEEDLRRQNRLARRRNLMMVAAIVVAVLLAAVCAFLALDRDRLAQENAQYGRAQADEKQIIAKEAQKALCGTKDSEIYDKAICEKLADAAQEPPPPEAPTAVVGPTQEELVKAFREYCAAGNCQGRDGTSPTADDIASAFVRFCSDGRCTGPAGKDGAAAENGKDGAPGEPGANGVDGADGVSLPPSGEMVLAAVTTYCSSTGACVGPAGKDGAPGPAPTAEAVLAAVQQVCANNACVGPMGPAGADSTVPGPAGPAGEPGTPGRGIQAAFCGDDRRWLITYTDGTTQDAGACRETFIPPAVGATP